MAVIQMGFKDNADNETGFKIYRKSISDGESTSVSVSDHHIATIELAGDPVAWTVTAHNDPQTSADLLNPVLSSTNSTDTATTGERFIFSYEETTAGFYLYGVAVTNDTGDSDIVSSSNQIQVQ
tara:strand:- start:134 stop:505 length:372 start_codon:yes stop_codon:yes gene_type:complete